jgi:hypothetical protein
VQQLLLGACFGWHELSMDVWLDIIEEGLTMSCRVIPLLQAASSSSSSSSSTAGSGGATQPLGGVQPLSALQHLLGYDAALSGSFWRTCQ